MFPKTSIAVLHTPVLLIAFNRPQTTEKVFEAIKKVKPSRLYFACDGPRSDREGECDKVEKVRMIAKRVDWDCELKTLFHHKNLGCKYGVSRAISWFFENEEGGIILEDDCLPNQDFFYFCQNLLTRFKNDPRVMAITGNNFQYGQRHGDASYYFSKYMHIWGWASWKRVWDQYDVEMKYWDDWKVSKSWNTLFDDAIEKKYWLQVFERVSNGCIDTWDYQLIAHIWRQGGVVATPNINLVANIGFGPDATHTISANNFLSKIVTGELGPISHPKDAQVNKAADKFVFDYLFEGQSLRFPMLLLTLSRRLLGRLYRYLKNKL